LSFYVNKYQFETLAIGLLLSAFVMLLVGKAQNYKIADSWHKKNLPLIKEQFAYVGTDDKNPGTLE
jgi:hypothetical protein